MVLVPSPNLYHFQEAGKRRLPAIQVTAAASDRNGFDGSLAVPAGRASESESRLRIDSGQFLVLYINLEPAFGSI